MLFHANTKCSQIACLLGYINKLSSSFINKAIICDKFNYEKKVKKITKWPVDQEISGNVGRHASAVTASIL